MNTTYVVELTEAEYHHLLRIAPDGIQAAMEATVYLKHTEPTSRTERGHEAPAQETD